MPSSDVMSLNLPGITLEGAADGNDDFAELCAVAPPAAVAIGPSRAPNASSNERLSISSELLPALECRVDGEVGLKKRTNRGSGRQSIRNVTL